MAGGSVGSSSVKISGNDNQNYGFAFTIMVSLFFMIGFITVLNDVLTPSLKGLFQLTVSQSQNVSLVFFGAYGIMSVPSGLVIKNLGYKKGLMIGLFAMAIGLFGFVPASMFVSYNLFLVSLFVVASGLTILQVAINPYIVALGPEETGAARLNLGGALNSTATFLGPIIGGAFILKNIVEDQFGSNEEFLLAKADAVKGPYIILALITILIGVILYFTNLPRIIADDNKEKLEGNALQYRNNIFGSIAIFFYVGTEVAIGILFIDYVKYLGEIGVMPVVEEALAASLLAYYWGSAMIGRFAGAAIAKIMTANNLLKIVTVAALILVSLSMTGFALNNHLNIYVLVIDTKDGLSLGFQLMKDVPYAVFFLVLVGLCNSVMWPSIFPLGIAKLGKYTSQGSGFLVTMVVGGAVIPKLQGYLVDMESIGFRYSFILNIICYGYLLFFAIEGYKPIKNGQRL